MMPHPLVELLSCFSGSYPGYTALFLSDESGAMTRYGGAKFLFPSVPVEAFQSHFYHGQYYGEDIPSGIRGPGDYFIDSQGARFIPKEPVYLQGVGPGSIVDIFGTVIGLNEEGILIFEDCWIDLVGGEYSPEFSY